MMCVPGEVVILRSDESDQNTHITCILFFPGQLGILCQASPIPVSSSIYGSQNKIVDECLHHWKLNGQGQKGCQIGYFHSHTSRWYSGWDPKGRCMCLGVTVVPTGLPSGTANCFERRGQGNSDCQLCCKGKWRKVFGQAAYWRSCRMYTHSPVFHCLLSKYIRTQRVLTSRRPWPTFWNL